DPCSPVDVLVRLSRYYGHSSERFGYGPLSASKRLRHRSKGIVQSHSFQGVICSSVGCFAEMIRCCLCADLVPCLEVPTKKVNECTQRGQVLASAWVVQEKSLGRRW